MDIRVYRPTINVCMASLRPRCAFLSCSLVKDDGAGRVVVCDVSLEDGCLTRCGSSCD